MRMHLPSLQESVLRADPLLLLDMSAFAASKVCNVCVYISVYFSH